MRKIYSLVMVFLFSITASAQVVISQVYGGGGNTGAPLNRDFVELFNKGTSAVDISNWSIQYQSATNTTNAWSSNTIPANTTIQPNKYFLIAFGTPGANGTALPTPDFDYSTGTPNPLAMSGTSGRVAIVNNSTALLAGCNAGSPNIIDLVGYGPTTICFEGSGPVAILSNTTAALRLNNGCTDTANNSTDFQVVAPAPRNSAFAATTVTSGGRGALTKALKIGKTTFKGILKALIIKSKSKKVDLLFKNRSEAMNWARNQLGHDTQKIFDSSGKWIGWTNSKGSVYWGHGDWGKGMGSSTFPHLNYNIGNTKGHLFLENKIKNRGMWDDFINYFSDFFNN